MLEDFRLQVFMTVVRERSFTKAAAELGVSQPAVSQNIAELEKTIGCRLFERLRGEVVLTGEGEVFMSYAGRLLRTCAEIEDMFAPLPAAVVRISASEELYNYMVSPALESFRRLHPQVTFERTMFENADLVLSLRPSAISAYDVLSDSVARIRMSVCPVPEMGKLPSANEATSYFDVIFQPTAKFSCTRLCRLIRTFLNPLP
jgi:DNA-binding transcriptional LysR family regulator